MPITYITRRERFSAAHRLFVEGYSDEKNNDIYGICSRPNMHGHNYELFVTIRGEVNPTTGYIMNLKLLSKLLKEKVIDKLDHSNINIDVDFMKGLVSTTENLAIAIWNCIEADIKLLGAELYKVKIQETENNFVEYMGE
ncbi:MAG: 6-carboxytetrahydropterin synthase [Bacteroidales bacterium]|nr:6-carboxytetrahydropterin synthase [Tenuifilaceae bacterium]